LFIHPDFVDPLCGFAAKRVKLGSSPFRWDADMHWHHGSYISAEHPDADTNKGDPAAGGACVGRDRKKINNF